MWVSEYVSKWVSEWMNACCCLPCNHCIVAIGHWLLKTYWPMHCRECPYLKLCMNGCNMKLEQMDNHLSELLEGLSMSNELWITDAELKSPPSYNHNRVPSRIRLACRDLIRLFVRIRIDFYRYRNRNVLLIILHQHVYRNPDILIGIRIEFVSIRLFWQGTG